MPHKIMESSQKDYAPVELFQKAIARWWLVALLFLVGALVGGLAYSLLPHIYEARAAVLTTVDFSNTGVLTQFEEDLMMDAVGWVLQSPEVIDRVVARAAEQNISVDSAGWKKMATVERRLGTWELRVRDSSPQVARALANIWLEEGDAVLKDAYLHTEEVSRLLRYSHALEICLEQSAASETSSVLCSASGLAGIQAEMQDVSVKLAAERAASRGLIAGILLGEPQPALLPDRPVTSSRGLFLLSGGLIGLLAGFVLSQARIRLGKWEI
jgi:uncharacterized protein involved in exopolysaccharide biosynthesis